MKLIDILHKANRRLAVNNSIWEKLQLRRVARMVIKVSANTLLPLTYRLSTPQGDDKRPVIPVVVSLTSFPVRIGRLWIVIESILRQTVRPERIVLWLSREQFPNEERDLPKSLLEQRSRGLDIRFVDRDIRSHKKYYYAFQEFKDKDVITIDDDLLYPSNLIENLYNTSLQNPEYVIANFGSRYIWDDENNYIKSIPGGAKAGDKGSDLLIGSGGGTLFHANKLLPNLDSIKDIVAMCPTADDTYLNALTRVSGLGIMFYDNGALLSVVNKNDIKLYDHNGRMGDINSVNADQLRAVSAHMKSKYGYNPFKI